VAYAFQHDETVPDAIRRIMDEQIVRAREHLHAADVHNARKRFKEIRALIRLVPDPLENAWFRDAARDLASARDAEAVLEALQKLELPRNVQAKVKKQLTVPKDPELDARIANVLEQLVLAQARIALWPEREDSFETIAGGLMRTYRGGRRGLDAESAEELHEWRKRVKEHWYHAQLLRHSWPEMMKPYTAVLDELAKSLGDHHDLAVLRERVADPPPALVKSIEKRQQELEKRAREIGRRVYVEKPDAWLARTRKVWHAWRTS
jgi:CHAD domain-containing protein